ncbi:phosphatidylinositol N-acetylglucosaminyltransferase [Chlorella sorokiniana]|uniref:Phosphatidylinositol N-acetylglucosaminyltransferase n=1 Tax=Chlorella sorokiniana TaxID=3076 RepID=A0A2P6U2Z8_CHLSO|nr:phosphatidylinositol N-acetylglucosaminyltransferase [Chlorella sorokiniana]|eukprot:PRW60685.1 phosphatidylinositol N-acetylglucosaminyltransferase [Chlorella sorokiniana]
MQPKLHAEAQLALAQAAPTRSCAYLRCANLGGEGGPAAGQGAGSMRCSACRAVWYCGTACSHADWRAGHKRVCKALGAARRAAKEAAAAAAAEAAAAPAEAAAAGEAAGPTAAAAAAAATTAPPEQPSPPQLYASPPRRPWRKVLYERQPHGDAYTAESFLEELVVNATVPQRDYATVAWSTLVVDQQLASVAIVGSASFQLYRGGITARQLLLADLRSAGGSAPPISASGLLDWRQIADGASSLAALAAATGLLSPLLGTLTENVSSDSIIACACLLLLAHLYLHDYHFTAGLTAHLSGSLALGCAVCGSVLIASRLRSPLAVYAQLLLSLELYILGPYCRRQVAAASPAAHAALTAGMAGTAGALLSRHSPLLTSAFGCALAFITLVCPWWLVRIHKFKAAINGPWDEAVPRLSQRVRAQLARPL